ncbi:hypothetical protein OUZ56_007799 [Daphnia magna]|uniref:Uncharacterized protein n=1 Tax=Daphnia magna TaxID=35525 RepID=A0ABR0AB87_9CRUS|nr:hypothetical protein OUZ56_007799 [Daphnia magna]
MACREKWHPYDCDGYSWMWPRLLHRGLAKCGQNPHQVSRDYAGTCQTVTTDANARIVNEHSIEFSFEASSIQWEYGINE